MTMESVPISSRIVQVCDDFFQGSLAAKERKEHKDEFDSMCSLRFFAANSAWLRPRAAVWNIWARGNRMGEHPAMNSRQAAECISRAEVASCSASSTLIIITGRPHEAAILKQKLTELEQSEGRPMLTEVPVVF